MQIDGEVSAWIGITSSIACSLLAFGVSTGVMKEKVRALEKELDELREEQKHYVTFKHFDAVIEPMKKTLDNVQRDIKEILRVVSEKHSSRH